VIGPATATIDRVPLAQNVTAAFTQRPLNLGLSVGGDEAAVHRNRDLVLQAIGPEAARLFFLRQVHGTTVVKAWAGADHPAPTGDAVFTDMPGVALGVLIADCAPVLVTDPAAGLIGAAHAGRLGLAAGVVPALITEMTRAGADPAAMGAVIGPAICGQCYEVPAAMRAQVDRSAPRSACLTRSGTPGLDLRAGIRSQLERAGVGRIADDPRCTAESGELFSYRRDGTTGRFAGLIWRTGP
jgi:purine-nucleoside/S-methyl-5'-thioadenosine phosphorylase / adenosine deaminase